MERVLLENLLGQFHGCTFATMDTETNPKPGVLKKETGKRILLFRSPHYHDMVRRRLIEAGKNPNSFSLSDLSWGVRVPNLPLIEHKDETYLQTIELAPGEVKYYFLGRECDPRDVGIRPSMVQTNQGLPAGSEVIVRCYKLSSIQRITLMGETLLGTADKKTRSILKLKV